jgi:hypothetical protein
LKISYLLTGLAVCFIGKDLLIKGISSKFTAEGETSSKKLRIITTSPGLVFLIAGLTIIVTAIYRQTSFDETMFANNKPTESESTQTRQDVSKTDSNAVSDIKQMAKRITSYRLAAQSEEGQIANRFYDLCKQNLESGNKNIAADYFAKALSINPNVFETALKDKELNEIVNAPLMNSFIRTRLQIVLNAQAEQPLSPEAQTVISKLSIYSLTVPEVQNKTSADSIIVNIPLRAGIESSQLTLFRIKSLSKENPRALVNVLKNPKYRWLLQDKEIFGWLKASSESFFVEKN